MKIFHKTLIIIGLGFILSCGDDYMGEFPDDSELFDLTFDASTYLNQANFVDVIDNPYFPQIPGKTITFEGLDDDGEPIKVEEKVLEETKTIMGIRATVVLVKEWENGELTEETRDWYAQDIEGNVWYLGEAVDNYKNGKVTDHGGAWEGGVDGAVPGILMPENPVVGMKYRQEFLEGEAEDFAEIISLNEALTVPYGSYTNVLKTREWNPFEKNSDEYKYWAEGVGFLRAESLSTSEYEELTSVSE